MQYDFPVGLVCMPFFIAMRPSIQIGLLHAIAARAGFAAESHQLNLALARTLGPDLYDALCSHRHHMTGEWLFSYAAFGADVGGEEEYFAAFPDEIEWTRRVLGKDTHYLADLRRRVLPEFLDECAALDWGKYRLVGFTSTFQQNVASLALARRIKAAHPHVLTLFGGANFEDEMGPEYVRAFPFVDLAIVGEADVAFPRLLERLAMGAPLADVPGLVRRCGGRVVAAPQAPPLQDLDSLPVPDYSEYFARQASLGLDARATWSVPFESSRGCWWGRKHHCTFCGLNGLGMTFRAKQPQRVLEEIDTLAARHGITFFEATDNILDMKYVDTLFDAVSARRLDYEFFYEVKANLTKAQIRRLFEGGVRWVQPGIESLSTPVLDLMRKGATMLQNVRLLKWCRYYGIRVSWNLIWGFPGEQEAHYADELRVLEAIPHLEPPGGCGRIWLERFSPYFNDRERYCPEFIRPEASYRHVYPPEVDLDRAAYFFDYDFPATLPEEAHGATGEFVTGWRARFASAEPDALAYRNAGATLFVDDRRVGWPRGTHTFEGPMRDLFLHCDETARTASDAARHLTDAGHETDLEAVRTALHGFVSRGLMVTEDDRFLSVALPSQPNR